MEHTYVPDIITYCLSIPREFHMMIVQNPGAHAWNELWYSIFSRQLFTSIDAENFELYFLKKAWFFFKRALCCGLIYHLIWVPWAIPSVCNSRFSIGVPTLEMFGADVLSRGWTVLQALNGCMFLVSERARILYIAESIEKHIGFTQVTTIPCSRSKA